ncbi:cytosine permease [Streptomyces sp. NPDC048278]|uniref:purine-cytosine permease family protein n=1 Tax=Streptomyces sp. NPDC048278 TaxID=3155809 RepID=UPI00343E5C0E
MSDASYLAAEPSPAPPEEAVDRFGRIESVGVEYIGPADRHGRPRELFAVWLSSNLAYFYILVGGLLPVLGLSIWQSFAVLAAGHLFWALVGLLAVSGPSTGSPSSVVTRAMYGVRGNRVFGAGAVWVLCIAYEGLNLAIGADAGFSLASFVGAGTSAPVKVAVTVLIGVVTFAMGVYGHATIVRLSVWFSALLGASTVALGFFVVRHATLHPAGFHSLAGSKLWASVLIGFTAVAALPLGWPGSADYARYLPRTAAPRAVAGWTAFGGWIPAMALGSIGILAGSAIDMSDPQTNMRAILPSWFYAVFLLVLVVGSITNNVLTVYSSGLALQAMGVRISRARSVIADAVLGGALCVTALASTSFLTSMSNVLALSVALLGPFLAVYGTDILLRRNRYDGPALHDTSPSGPFWFHNGVNWSGVLALAGGTAAALLCVNTTVFVGPVATAIGGGDLSALVGPAVAALLHTGGSLLLGNHRKGIL